jgi:hypothetical protein
MDMQKMAAGIVVWLKQVLESRDRKIAHLESKVADLETKQLPMWAGIHEKGKAYCACSLVTRDGGLWLATQTTDTTPGQGATPWKLVVKSGGAAFKFKSGSVVQDDDGTPWVALRETRELPGAGDDWRLVS